MKLSDIPKKFVIPFANSASASYIRDIPVDSQIGVEDGAASLHDGFVPLNFQPLGSGGVPPFGKDFNGLLKQITAWNRWDAAGGFPMYDAAFAASVNGYPRGAVVASTTVGGMWLCILDDNTSDPDAGGAGWVKWGAGAQLPKGLVVYQDAGTYTWTPPSGTQLAIVTVVGPGGGGSGSGSGYTKGGDAGDSVFTNGGSVTFTGGGGDGGGGFSESWTPGYAGVGAGGSLSVFGGGATAASKSNNESGGNGGNSIYGGGGTGGHTHKEATVGRQGGGGGGAAGGTGHCGGGGGAAGGTVIGYVVNPAGPFTVVVGAGGGGGNAGTGGFVGALGGDGVVTIQWF